ncbi:MAG: adenylate/guanylate cyclase domain-containing protein, partial [Acidimicrobiia bacterium]
CGAPRPGVRPHGEPEGDRRIVTVLFADLVGSTAVAERLDPEIWADAAGEALASMSAAIGRYGGTVARLMGDGILAFFGAPESHEDDAERAVRAGLELAKGVARLRSRLESGSGWGISLQGDELSVRVGINTGLVVVGEVGGEAGSEFTALGDAVNVAARLQQVASPGAIVVSASTAALVEDVAVLAPAGTHMLKGKAEPVATFRVLDLNDGPRGARPESATLVGRVGERATLSDAMEELSAGLGGIVVVLGDAGLGKSRLLSEARSAGGGGVSWYQAAARSFESGRPYALAAHLVEALAGTEPGEVIRYLTHLAPGRREAVAEMLTRLEMPPEVEDRPWAEAVTDAFEELLVGATSVGVTAVVVATDDVHWADVASVELLVRLFPLTDRLPILFLAAARPERHSPAWLVKQAAEQDFPHRYTEITLTPLDADESAELVAELAGDLESDLVTRIADRAGGNPFYLEELVREVGSGDGDRSDLLPGSLQTLIRARLDRLEPSTQAALETAAVIGRSFGVDILERTRARDVMTDLGSALRAGIVEVEDPRLRTYTFRHALTQEAVYESILLKRRRLLHLQVARALESSPEGAPAAVLAEHFGLAGEEAKAGQYRLAAGDEAFRLQAMEEALTHYRLGLAVAQQLSPETAIALLRGRGRTRSLRGDLDGGIADAEDALAQARAEGLMEAEWDTLTALGQMWAARDYERTGHYYRQALEVARRSGDMSKTATSLNLLGNWSINADDPAAGVRLHEEALAMFERVGSSEGAAASHDLLGMAGFISGDFESAASHYELAVGAFRELGDRVGLASALAAMGFRSANYEVLTAPPVAEPEEGIAYFRESIELCVALGWPAGEAFGRFGLAQVLGARGEMGEAMTQAETALQIAQRIGHDQWQVGALVALGMLEGDLLDFEACREHLSEAVSRSWEIRSSYWILQSSSLAGMAALGRGEIDLARSLA